jgi:hypothetical protein
MYYHCVYADATVASAEDNESIMNIANATVASAEVEYTYWCTCTHGAGFAMSST